MSSNTYIFDFDSTLVSVETLDELARIALADNINREQVVAELSALTDRGMCGELPFDKSLQQRLQLFKANKKHVEKLTSQLLGWLSPSVKSNLEWFRSNHERIYVVSGGFADYIKTVTEYLGIKHDHVFANRFEYNAGGDIIGFDQNNLLSKAGGKVWQVESLKLPRPIIVIGDGYTDYEIRKAGKPTNSGRLRRLSRGQM